MDFYENIDYSIVMRHQDLECNKEPGIPISI